jgi:adenylosuccinate synthase
MQWGDEGKGKIVDLLGEGTQIVARYQGGHNAGHTVRFDDETFILHLIPTGILRSGTLCLIGNGVVIDPDALLGEMQELEKRNVRVEGRVKISRYAHFILPYHVILEKCLEERGESGRIGTTGRGIGPAYADKIYRLGIRVEDVLDEDRLKHKVDRAVLEHNHLLSSAYGAEEVAAAEVLDSLLRFRDRFRDSIVDVSGYLHRACREGKSILIEGAQGTLLDVDFGTYPFVTSSHTIIGGASSGLGLPIRKIDKVIGVAKAYTTRVGNGPFPTELTDDMGDFLRKAGSEFGATTGRPRRCGWFDAVVVSFAIKINDVDYIALTKLDVLDDLDEIKICTGYTVGDEVIGDWTETCAYWEDVKPVYETMPGWKQSLAGISSFEELPEAARNYIGRLEELCGVPMGIISVGSGREETIMRGDL